MVLALIVDDDPSMRLLAAEMLGMEGFEVEQAENGADGLAAFQRLRPDVVLLDIDMPGMGGFECCARIRWLPSAEHVPIVFLAGQESDDTVAQAFEVGATDFVGKPAHWRLLGHRIRRLVRAGSTLAELEHSQTNLAHAQRLAHLGHWEYRRGCRQGHWSEEMYRILGLAAGRHAASVHTLMELVPDNERDRLYQAFSDLGRTGCGYSLEHRILRPDGGERIVFQRAEAIWELGRFSLLRGTLQDITEYHFRAASRPQ